MNRAITLIKACVLVGVIVVSLTFTGCFNNELTPSSATEVDTVREQQLKEQIDDLQKRTDSYNKYFDKSIKTAIDGYCENYLTFNNRITESSVKKTQKYITDEYYDELISQPLNEGGQTDVEYFQSTAADELYYEDISEKLKNEVVPTQCEVVALCYQSVTLSSETTNTKVLYRFYMQYQNKQWLISAVEILS